MQVDVNGTRLWFDVDGPALVPDGSTMSERPTVVLLHGGPGGYDHSYFKPDFTALTTHAQVVYLDLRDHGRSARHDPGDWTFEVCADDVRAFCDTVGIAAPIVYGHSMGGFIAMLYAARHPDHAAALVLQSTCARFDLDRLVEGVRRVAGDDVAAIARRDYGGDPVSDEEWARVFAAFGPRVPDEQQMAPQASGIPSSAHTAWSCSAASMWWISCPASRARRWSASAGWTRSRPSMPSREIVGALRDGVGRLEVIAGAGHFPWLDAPAVCSTVIREFVAATTR